MSKKKRFPWLTALGVLLTLIGLAGLYSGQEISQYVFLPGEADYEKLLDQATQKWAGAFETVSLHGVAEQVSLTSERTSQGEITVYETAGGYFEIYPRAFSAGSPITRGCAGQRVIVLDGALAFRLFGDRDPLDQTGTLGEKKYQVIGVAAHARGTGETGEYAAWIPLGVEGAPACSSMVLSAGGKAGGSLHTVFQTTAKEVFGKGQAFFLSKERTRGTILLRAVLVLLGIRALAAWIGVLRRRIRGIIAEIRKKLETSYPRQMAGTLIGRGLEGLALTALTVGAAALLTVWAAEPLMIVPEWVPEVFVDPESILQRFRELTAAAAAPVQFRTPEMAEIRLWSGVVRWGTVTALLGWVLHTLRKPEGRNREETGFVPEK